MRKTAKWCGALATALLLVAWIGSAWRAVEWLTPSNDGGVVLDAGRLCIFQRTGPIRYSVKVLILHRFASPGPELRWWFESNALTGFRILWVPLWFPALVSLLATAAAWRADSKYLRRARVGMCPACGYDRAGLAAGVACPECGAAASA